MHEAFLQQPLAVYVLTTIHFLRSIADLMLIAMISSGSKSTIVFKPMEQ